MGAFLPSFGLSRVALGLAGLGATVLIGFTAAEIYEHKAPWGLGPKLESARLEVTTWRGHAKANHDTAVAYARSFGESEALRRRETGQAVDAFNDLSKACDGRVARAKASADAISNLLRREVPHDAQGCPVRRLIDPGELRDAVRPPAH